MRGKLEVLAMTLGIIGLAGVIAITALPMWKVTAFIGANLIVMEMQWEGLWMVCIRQADINMQCKVYDSLLVLPPDVQAARGLVCIAILLTFLAILVSTCGIRRTTFCQSNDKGKKMILMVGACLFLASALATLIPVCWTTHTIVRVFYNPTVMDSQKREIGQALYVGYATALVLVVAGAILIVRYRKEEQEEQEEQGVYAPEEVMSLKRTPSELYEMKQYV